MLLSFALLALISAPQTPDPTLPPSTVHIRFTVEAQGLQIYHCAAQADTFAWVYDAPDATLFDTTTHQPIGHHSAGPTWTWSDGSAITGKVLQKQPSPDPLAIHWLLVETHDTGDKTGALTGITFVRRSNTQAGAAPATGCDAQHQANILRVPYEATYTFYSAN